MKLAVNRIVKNWRNPAKFTSPARQFTQNTLGFGRRFISHTETELAESAFNAFNLHMDAPEPMFGHLIGNNYADGAFVHPHRDPAPNGFNHVRCNWMVKKPTLGGNPILDGEEIIVNEGDLWLCIANRELHSTTPIFGGERLIYSFGSLICDEQLSKIIP